MAILWHGTTRDRAIVILSNGPDSAYVEPGGVQGNAAEGFSTMLSRYVPNPGDPSCEDYARMKAKNFPNEGGPAIVEVEVPDDLVNQVLNDPITGMAYQDSGEIRFDFATGLAELLHQWPRLTKRMIIP